MTTIGEAVEALGVHEVDGYEVVLFHPDGETWRHYRLSECATTVVNGDAYLTSGLFFPNTVTRFAGRKGENVARILFLPFDFDLYTWIGCTKETVWAMEQPVIDDLIAGLQVDVEEMFRVIGLPIHRLDYTGHGLAVAINVPPHPPENVAAIKALHKGIVGRINIIARQEFADPEVSDAGTRGMRLVPCHNTKGAIVRQTRTIYQRAGVVTEEQLRSAAGDTGTRPPVRAIPTTGQAFDAATETAIIEVMRPHWTAGNRHQPALALAGLFAKAGVPEEQTERIVASLIATAGGTERDVLKAVHTSYERVRAGLAAVGFMGLQTALPSDVADWLDGIAAKVRAATAPVLVLRNEKPPTQRPEPVLTVEAVPKIAFFGWFKDYLDLVEPLCESADAFHLASSLVLAGATVGRRIAHRYVSRSIYPNVYAMIVGASGASRKDTAIGIALDMPYQKPLGVALFEKPYGVATDVGSAEGLVKVLSQQPNTLLYVTEFQRLIKNAKRQSTGTIFPLLTEAWNTPVMLQNVTKGEPLKAEFPFLSVIAAVQPGILAQEMRDEDVQSGFAGRWLYFLGEGKAPRPDPPDIDAARAYALYADFRSLVDSYVRGQRDEVRIGLTDGAKIMWNDWYASDVTRAVSGEEEDTMRSRLAIHVRKAALIYAISEGAGTIDVRHLDAAIALVEWCWRHTRELLRSWGVGIGQEIELLIERTLKGGSMTRRDLQRACTRRKWTGKDFAWFLDGMIKNDRVVSPSPGVLAWGG